MALGTEQKLGIAVVVLVGLGGLLYFQNKKQKEEAASYTAETRSADLPKIELKDDQIKGIDKITFSKPPGDAGKGVEVTLEKQGDKWMVTAPVKAEANQTNVSSLLTNLKQLKVAEEIDPAKTSYEKYGLADGKALHATFGGDGNTLLELWLGDSGGRGQMARIAGHDSVYALKGYSSFLYDREVKDWRDRTVFKFEEDKVAAIDIENENGTFAFKKEKDKWTAKLKGPKDPAAKALDKFDESKLKQAIGAFKALNADNFATDKKEADVGLDKPVATITFVLGDGAKKTLHIGATAEGSSRWAKADGSDEIISVGSWPAEFAMAKADKFQKTEGDAGAPSGGPPGGGMPHPMMMPPMGGME